MATRYLVTAKNPNYEGKTYGVRFHEGSAVVDEHSISKHLGRTVEQVVDLMQKDFGLEVVPMDEAPAPKEETPAAPAKKVKKEAAND